MFAFLTRLVTAKNLYASNVTGISNCLERMNLAEPQARKWVQDKNWTDHFDGSIKSSYNSFLDYLDKIRSVGPDHWKSLQVIGFPSVEKDTHNHHTEPIETNENFSDSDNVSDINIQSEVTATESEEIFEAPSEDDTEVNDSDTVEYLQQFCENSTISTTKKKLPIVPLPKLMGRLYSGNTDCVLTFGGCNHHRSTGCHVFRYLPMSNSWDLIGMMPAGRQFHSAVFFQKRIYVVGGLDTASRQMVSMHRG